MFNVKEFNVEKFDGILARGLSNGLGKQGSQVCIEAAVCEALGLPHGDDPGCVANSVRSFKIRLNDSRWSSEKARAAGLRDLGLAQLGSRGVVDDTEFMKRVAEKTIRVLIPKVFKLVFPTDEACLIAASRCAEEGTREAANAAAYAAYAANAANAAAYAADAAAYAAYAADAAADAANAAANAAAYAAAYAANAANAAYAANAAAYAAANAAAYAANAAANAANAAYAAAYAAYAAYAANAANAAYAANEYLILSAKIGLEVLRELNSPGVALL